MTPRSIAAVLILFCGGAMAQETEPGKGGAAPARSATEAVEGEAAERSNRELGSAAEQPARDKNSREQDALAAMTRYEMGELQEALLGLRSVINECLAVETDCESEEVASYYGRLAVVLSSASENSQAAVVVWRKALVLDPTIEIAPEHRTPRVLQAYGEAERGDEPSTASDSPSPTAPLGGGGAEMFHRGKLQNQQSL